MSNRIDISFILPAKNEADYIDACLSEIEQQITYTSLNCEIIVVDNNSSDETSAISNRHKCEVIKSYSIAPSIVRNEGARKAKGRIFCFVDADCVLTAGWLDRINHAFEDESIGAFGGPHVPPDNSNWLIRTWYPKDLKNIEIDYGKLPGSNFSIRASIFKKLRGFDEKLISAEDEDLSRRVVGIGFKSFFSTQHQIIHLAYPDSFLRLFKQQIWHGSSQFEANGLTGDKLLLLTFGWVALIPVMIFFYVLKSGVIWLWIIVLVTPILISLNKLKYEKKPKYIRFILKSYPIAFIFLSGRAYGLIKELVTKLFK